MIKPTIHPEPIDGWPQTLAARAAKPGGRVDTGRDDELIGFRLTLSKVRAVHAAWRALRPSNYAHPACLPTARRRPSAGSPEHRSAAKSLARR